MICLQASGSVKSQPYCREIIKTPIASVSMLELGTYSLSIQTLLRSPPGWFQHLERTKRNKASKPHRVRATVCADNSCNLKC
jgi:hypothetical protein